MPTTLTHVNIGPRHPAPRHLNTWTLFQPGTGRKLGELWGTHGQYTVYLYGVGVRIDIDPEPTAEGALNANGLTSRKPLPRLEAAFRAPARDHTIPTPPADGPLTLADKTLLRGHRPVQDDGDGPYCTDCVEDLPANLLAQNQHVCGTR